MNEQPSGLFGQRFVGQRLPRKEDARLLTGRGTFVDDVVVPGMLHAAFHRSPIARGRITSIDVSEARALPGVLAVYLAEDLAAIQLHLVSFFMIVPPPGTKTTPLADGRVAYVGDPIALVIAETRYVAEDAASLIQVDYAEEDPVVTIAQALTSPPIHPDLPSNLTAVTGKHEPIPTWKRCLRRPHTSSPIRCATSALPRRRWKRGGLVVSPNGDNELTIHLSCASPHVAARQISLAFGLPATNIRIIAKDVGGSFGQKTQVWREEFATIVAALLLRRPVKWIEDRLEHLLSANQAREQECTLKLAFDKEARLLGCRMDYTLDNGAFPHYPDQTLGAALFMWGAYRLPRFDYRLRACIPTPSAWAAIAGPGRSRRWRARRCSTSQRGRSASIRLSCAGAT